MVILAAIDENERSRLVAETAYDLATTYGDTLVALHVVPTEDFESYRESIREIPEFRDFSVEQEIENAEEFALEFFQRTIDGVDTGIVEPRGRIGDPPTKILEEAARLDPHFLVISGRRRSPAGKAIFGNTAQRILLNADCPVVSNLTDE